MPLKIYNTLQRRKEEFEPLIPNKVRFYLCGATVYDLSHLGHARANVSFDVIFRYLKFLGYDVTYVRNFTDVDDKIIKRAQESKISPQELAEKFIVEFEKDMKALGNETPTIQPKATEHIPQMIRLIEKLIEKNLAYPSNGDVFYRVRNFKNYGSLSGKNIEELESGARVEVMESKSDPLDFALWKSSKPGEPFWDSPWGNGRPGWHIECSAMSMEYLGETFDIHAGGRDLIFPHHENEIAQSEGATEKPFAKYWLHNGFVNINAHKMSKSTGNFFTIQDILKVHDWETVRAFLISVHYKSPIDFTENSLSETKQALERYYLTISRVKHYVNNSINKDLKNIDFLNEYSEKIEHLFESYEESMNDDFNTAMVLGYLFESVRMMNKLLDQGENFQSNSLLNLCNSYLKTCEKIGSILGCFTTDSEGFFQRNQKKALSEQSIDEAKILQLIEERKLARQNKDFKRSDEIRDQLLAMNIVLKDKPDGVTEWQVKA